MGWSATWEYLLQGPENRPVRAYPNVGLTTRDSIPAQLSDIYAFDIDVAWTYGSGSTISLTTDYAQLATDQLNANICVDMFIAQDESKSSSTTDADFEVMIWFGKIGLDVDPLGFPDGIVDTRIINETTLYVDTLEQASGAPAKPCS